MRKIETIAQFTEEITRLLVREYREAIEKLGYTFVLKNTEELDELIENFDLYSFVDSAGTGFSIFSLCKEHIDLEKEADDLFKGNWYQKNQFIEDAKVHKDLVESEHSVCKNTQLKCVEDEGGGEGGGEYCSRVWSIKFPDEENVRYFRYDFSYYSYNGYSFEYHDAVTECKEEKVEVIQYNRI